jgi:hypothetical protein
MKRSMFASSPAAIISRTEGTRRSATASWCEAAEELALPLRKEQGSSVKPLLSMQSDTMRASRPRCRYRVIGAATDFSVSAS